jgi:hypothetical protein
LSCHLESPPFFVVPKEKCMLLIDALEKRTDTTRLVEGANKIEANYSDGWTVTIDGAMYYITGEAFDNLLNLLRVPIKYIRRCVEDEGKFLAEASINYWLEKYGDLSFLIAQHVEGYVEMPCITQVFPGKSLYIPGVKVNDFIFDYIGNASVRSFIIDDDVFNAVYVTDQTIDLLNETFNYGIRVLYSDCFKITPRFDGVLCSKEGSLLAYPTTGRKFRVAGSNIPQVFEQIEEFLDLSIDGLNEHLIPKLQTITEDHPTNVFVDGFLTRLCAELRLSKKIQVEMGGWFQYTNQPLGEIILIIGKRTAELENSHIDVEMARDIQIAISHYISRGKFK